MKSSLAPILGCLTFEIYRTSNKKLISVHLRNLYQWILPQSMDKRFYSRNLDWVVQVHSVMVKSFVMKEFYHINIPLFVITGDWYGRYEYSFIFLTGTRNISLPNRGSATYQLMRSTEPISLWKMFKNKKK